MYDLRLIGYPITHSLSPWIHKNFLKRADLKGTYKIHEITPSQSFSEEIEKMKSEGVNGFNVTIPYKEKIIPYVDELDDEAKKMGAVNTVTYKNGKWLGYNTDGRGYVRALYQSYPKVQQKKHEKVLLLGAGGAARGIYYALLKDGFHQIDIANRTLKSAHDIQALKGRDVKSTILSLEQAEVNLREYMLIIQTTSVGMQPNDDQSIISLSNVQEGAIVSDIVYQPLETKFLQEAKKHGANIHYGHSMLLYQAQYAFEIWTGRLFDISDMDQKMMQKLKGR